MSTNYLQQFQISLRAMKLEYASKLPLHISGLQNSIHPRLISKQPQQQTTEALSTVVHLYHHLRHQHLHSEPTSRVTRLVLHSHIAMASTDHNHSSHMRKNPHCCQKQKELTNSTTKLAHPTLSTMRVETSTGTKGQQPMPQSRQGVVCSLRYNVGTSKQHNAWGVSASFSFGQ